MKTASSLIILFVLLFTACRTNLENTMPQPENTSIDTYIKSYSFINLPIEIPLQAIEDEINRQFSDIIYDDQSFDTPEKDDIMLRIWKTRNIKVQGYNEFIKYDVPLRIWANYRWKGCDFCPVIEKSTEFNILVSFTSKIKVMHDWTFITQTVPSGLTFESKPKLDFGIVSIPITAIVEPIVKEQLKDVTLEIDDEVAQNFNFSKEIDSVWQALYKPQLIDKTYMAWLKMTPQEIFLSPIKGNNESIKITAGFKGIFEVILGSQPENTPPLRLPALKSVDINNKDFNFIIETFIEFDAAAKIAEMHIKDSVLEITNKKKVKIEGLNFIGLGNRVYTKVDLSGSVNGSVYFIGTPVYNKEKQQIYFKDFDFDITTKNALLKSANWLLHGPLKNKIKKEFNYEMAEDFKAIKETLNTLLSGYSFEDLMIINGELSSLDIVDIIVQDKGLRVIINSTGQAEIKVKSLDY